MRKLLPTPLSPEHIHWLDFTKNNLELGKVDLKNTSFFNEFVFNQIPKNKIGIGGWLENRAIYHRSEHFQQAEASRTYHLGLDLWTNALTPIFAPMKGFVHSFQNNKGFGDYGPTIIMEHNEAKLGKFYTLYGHLSVNSIIHLEVGRVFNEGDQIAEIGNFPENGDWPPHLHFQVMKSLEGNSGDFPGVCSKGNLEHYSGICIDPMEFLGIKKEHYS
jgi:murein DD-endopeptidase MepM/ murein hydrolase activator NlpD